MSDTLKMVGELYLNGNNLHTIANLLGLHVKSVRRILQRACIIQRKYKQKFTSIEIDSMIKKYRNLGTTMDELCQLHNIPYDQLKAIFKENHVPDLRNQKYKLNESFFENIDTEEKAYWLGFISADGYIHKDQKRLLISLADIDYVHLCKFRDTLDSNYPIYRYTRDNHPYASIHISSAKLIQDLSNLGVMNCKSLIFAPNNNIRNDLLSHYWRGLVDGDGSVYKRIVSKKYLQWNISLTGTYDTIQAFKLFLETRGVISKASIIKCKAKCDKIFYITYGGKHLSKYVAKILYENATLFLDRKMALAQECING